MPKDELIQNPAKHFLFGSELTLWDTLYKDMTRVKGLLFYCIHLEASTSSGHADAVGMLQAILQVMLQGAWLVDYYPKVLNGAVSAGCCACGPFCSWVLVPSVQIPGV